MHEGPIPERLSPLTVPIMTLYQPIVALNGREVVGYEALTRTDPAGTFTPQQLLSAAADDHCTAEFDWRCRSTALRGALDARLPNGLALFVNSEPTALDAAPPTRCLPLLAEASELSVIVEVTERDLAGDPAGLLRAVERARHLGWRVAIDDVGADSSSLALLPLLRPDVIKLDMALVHGRVTMRTAEIVAAVATESERTGAMVLAEGIETEEHEHTARSLGATLGQGYLFGAPEPLPQFSAQVPATPRAYPDAAITVRAPAAVTPYGVVGALGSPRHVDESDLDALEAEMMARAAETGASTVLLVTVDTATGSTRERADELDRLAERAAMTAVFAEQHDRDDGHYRTVAVGEGEPLARERSIVIVSPTLTVASVALHRGTGPDGSAVYDHHLTYERNAVLDAATVLLRRVPMAVQR